MTSIVERNLPHQCRPGSREVVVAACLLGQLLSVHGDTMAGTRDAAASATPAPGEAVPPPARPPEILAPPMPSTPAAGKGRLAWVISGNRRWCTYPDDRLIKPVGRPGQTEEQNEIFTFGYRFSISAVKRGNATVPLMLLESPIYRTAEWRLAATVGSPTAPGSNGRWSSKARRWRPRPTLRMAPALDGPSPGPDRLPRSRASALSPDAGLRLRLRRPGCHRRQPPHAGHPGPAARPGDSLLERAPPRAHPVSTGDQSVVRPRPGRRRP